MLLVYSFVCVCFINSLSYSVRKERREKIIGSVFHRFINLCYYEKKDNVTISCIIQLCQLSKNSWQRSIANNLDPPAFCWRALRKGDLRKLGCEDNSAQVRTSQNSLEDPWCTLCSHRKFASNINYQYNISIQHYRIVRVDFYKKVSVHVIILYRIYCIVCAMLTFRCVTFHKIPSLSVCVTSRNEKYM